MEPRKLSDREQRLLELLFAALLPQYDFDTVKTIRAAWAKMDEFYDALRDGKGVDVRSIGMPPQWLFISGSGGWYYAQEDEEDEPSS